MQDIVLVECKNWSKSVGSTEVNWFDAKLRSRGLLYGILIAAQGITGDAQDLTAAHHVIAGALREQRRLLVITENELLQLTDTDALVYMIKEKLCDLAVSGTIV
jgi:Restriction endonuclease